jgi:caffeoyl-CoA O-methyltransferase
MHFLPEEIEVYAEAHTEAESDLLRKLNRETHAKVLQPRMLSGHLQGRFLAFISKLASPERILEIGTYTGYSALCLCEGLSANGKLVTIDYNEELETFTRSFFSESPYSNQIDFRIANALDMIPLLDDLFDLVFIDADKVNYSNYYDLVIDKVRPGGIIIADNVLWSGKVTQKTAKLDKETQALLDFNKKINDDQRVSNVLLPLRDGLMMVQKNKA